MSRVEAASGAKYSSHKEQPRKFEPIAPVGSSYTPVGKVDISALKKAPPPAARPAFSALPAKPTFGSSKPASSAGSLYGRTVVSGSAPADAWPEEAPKATAPPKLPTASRPPILPTTSRPAFSAMVSYSLHSLFLETKLNFVNSNQFHRPQFQLLHLAFHLHLLLRNFRLHPVSSPMLQYRLLHPQNQKSKIRSNPRKVHIPLYLFPLPGNSRTHFRPSSNNQRPRPPRARRQLEVQKS